MGDEASDFFGSDVFNQLFPLKITDALEKFLENSIFYPKLFFHKFSRVSWRHEKNILIKEDVVTCDDSLL